MARLGSSVQSLELSNGKGTLQTRGHEAGRSVPDIAALVFLGGSTYLCIMFCMRMQSLEVCMILELNFHPAQKFGSLGGNSLPAADLFKKTRRRGGKPVFQFCAIDTTSLHSACLLAGHHRVLAWPIHSRRWAVQDLSVCACAVRHQPLRDRSPVLC
eukprot:1160843-Pelagomonas_calceolata.AAC.1